MKIHKEQILKLRAEGKSYGEIQKITGASKGTIAYHCGDGQKEKTIQRNREVKAHCTYISKTQRFKQKKANKTKARDFQRRNGSKLNDVMVKDFTYKDVLEKFGTNPVCYLTGEPIDLNQPKNYSFDHFIPATRGGNNSLENLRICLSKINKMKSDLLYEEFIELCKKVLIHHGYKISD